MENTKISLRAARVNAGFNSRAEVSKLIGVSTTSIKNWEQKRYFPDVITAYKMAELYHCTIDEIQWF